MTWSCSSSTRCCLPASTPRLCTPCTWTGRCRAPTSCRPWPGSTAASAPRKTACSFGYASLTDNLRKALAEYTPSDQADQTLGADIDRAISEVRNEHTIVCELLSGIGWRAMLTDTTHPRPRHRALRRVANHLRDPRTPGNTVEPGATTIATRFREATSRLERFYRLCAMSRDLGERLGDLQSWQEDIAFFVEARAWMVKLDAAEREATGRPLADEINLYLAQLAASAVEAEQITDLYAEAGLGQLDLTALNEDVLRSLQQSETPHLAAEALRRLIESKMREVTRHNVVRRESFAESWNSSCCGYMRQQLTSAEPSPNSLPGQGGLRRRPPRAALRSRTQPGRARLLRRTRPPRHRRGDHG
jgi:type I restriction enzyme R subunit